MKFTWLKTPRRWTGVAVAAAVLSGGYYYSYRSQISNTAEADSSSEMTGALPFTMTEVSKAIGVEHLHQTDHALHSNIEPFVNSNNATVAVADYDNDGFEDIFVNSAIANGKNALFHNNGDGTFTDVTEKAGLGKTPFSVPTTGGFFFDYDNDGYKDLLIISGTPRIFHNNRDGTFSEVTFDVGLNYQPEMRFLVPGIVDYDNDGYLDLVFAHQWGEDRVHYMPDSFTDASNGSEVAVFHNVKGKFERVADRLGFNQKVFGRAIGVFDFRGTGRPDIYFANDFSVDNLYFNEGGGKFRNVSENIVPNNFSRNGMSADAADVDNDGHPMIFVSHIFEHGWRPAGNTLWKWQDGDSFKEISRGRGVNRCGWAWGGKWIDLDNDGHLDLVVGNGFISANPHKLYWYLMSVMQGGDRRVVKEIENWPPMDDSSVAGYQHMCVYFNDGTGHFKNVTMFTGAATDVSDERGVAAIDYLNNGSQSLVIANQKQPLKFYRIDQKNNNKWIGFKLIGTRSNRDAFGSEMKIELADGTVLSRQLQPLNAYGSESDDRLHFGLGPSPTIKSIHLLWPSGQAQTFDGAQFAVGKYHKITEPK